MDMPNPQRNAVRTLCVVLLAALHCVGAAAPVATVNEPAGDSGLDALHWAYRFGAAIPETPHLNERSTCQYNALKAFLDRGQIETVGERLGEIQNWRRGVLCADLATAYAQREGVGLMLRHYLEQARLCRDTIEGHNAGWQQDRVTAFIAVAQARAGLLTEAEATLVGVEDPVVAQVQIERLARIEDDASYENAMQELATMGESVVLEVQEAAVRTYIRILETQGDTLTEERLEQMGKGMDAVLPKLPALLQCNLRLAAGQALLSNGRRDAGTRALQQVLAAIDSRSPSPRHDVTQLAELAQAYHTAAGDAAQAALLLRRAADLLRNAQLDLTDRVSATLALAEAYATCGQSAPAWTYFRAALAGAASQINGRPRHMLLTDLGLAVGRVGYDLPDDVRQTLEREWQRQGAPW